jgi:hypothetical protein
MHLSFCRLASAVALLGFAASAGAQTPPGPIDLFNGKDLTGWSLVTSQGANIAVVCSVTADGVMTVVGKPVGYLLAPGIYSDYKLHVEWRWPADAVKNSNSGVLVHIDTGPIDRNTWPRCFQVQTKLNRGGDILPMAGATFAEALSTPPGSKNPQINRQNPSSEKPLGEWNACDVVCQGGSLECTINGVVQNHVTGCKPGAGMIGIQLEGFPYELRNIRIEPLP